VTAVEWTLPRKPHGLPGLLVAFDGVDGSGKTTTIRLTAAYLRSWGFRARIFKLPSRELKRSSWFVRYSRDPLTAARVGDVDPVGMCAAVLGDRLISIRRSIVPHLAAGHVALVDRYLLTPLCELLIHGVDAEARSAVEPLVDRFPWPDLFVVPNVAAAEAIGRVRRRPHEADDSLSADVYSRRIAAFRALAAANDLLLLDTSRDVRATFGQLSPRIRQTAARLASNDPARLKRPGVTMLDHTAVRSSAAR
jgi:dTMP kinase